MLLKVENLKTQFFLDSGTVTAVDGISFDVPKGKTVCLVGESGSGKSITSLSIMRLIDRPGAITGGTITLDGVNLLDLPEKKMRSVRGGDIAMIFQEPMTSLNPSFTVGYQIKEVLKIHHGLKGKELHERAVDALRTVAIPLPEKRLNDYPFKLSGGMRQRVMIAMAIACSPKLLIADEPTTALDVTIQAQVLTLMNDLKERLGMSILFITHDLGVVSEMADEVCVMYTGRIVERAEVKTLFSKPMHPYTEGLLDSLPGEGGTRGNLCCIPGNVPSLSNLPTGCTFNPRCQYAEEMCRTDVPELKEVAPGHFCACFKAQGLLTGGEK